MKRVYQFLGLFLTILCLGFVAKRFLQMDSELSLFTKGPSVIGWTLALSIIYGLSLFILARAWATLVCSMSSEANSSTLTLMRTYGQSSIAKYLPGNIFHFAGRQILGAQEKLAQAPLAFASVFEILVSIVVVLFTCSLLFVFSNVGISIVTKSSWIVASTLLLLFSIVLPFFNRITQRFSARFSTHSLRPFKPETLAKIHLLVFIFFVCMAGIVMAAAYALDGQPSPYVFLAGAYLLSWLAGFLVPGMAGGLGVREATMIGLMTPHYSEEMVLSLAFLTRLISTIGDLIFWTGSFLLPRANTGGGNISA